MILLDKMAAVHSLEVHLAFREINFPGVCLGACDILHIIIMARVCARARSVLGCIPSTQGNPWNGGSAGHPSTL